MTKKNRHTGLALLTGLGLLMLAIALAPAGTAETTTESDPTAHAEHEGHSSHTDHAGHAHGAGSDLDRAVDELFAADCEHGVRAHACADCRYEVGVVAMPEDLCRQGLMATGSAEYRHLAAELELTGEIEFDTHRIAHLGPRATGIVRQVRVDLGQRVAVGDVLIELDSAALAAAEAAFLEARAAQRQAERAYERQAELHEAKISSEREYLEAERARDEADVRLAARRQELLRLGLSAAEVTALAEGGEARARGELRVRAPFDGEVITLHAALGERIEPGRELVTVADPAQLWIWVDVYESQLAGLLARANSGPIAAAVSVRSFPDKEFAGVLDFVGRVMDQTTRTVKARITVENRGGLLRPGMFATARIAAAGQPAALVVPRDAVLADEGREFVFVHHAGDYYVRRPVVTGHEHDGYVEVLTGLTPEQTIVTGGAFLLKSDVLRSKMGAGCAH